VFKPEIEAPLHEFRVQSELPNDRSLNCSWSNEFCLQRGNYLLKFAVCDVDSTANRNIDTAAAMAIMRGGSWKDKYTALTSASRVKFPKTTGRDDAVGFRCLLIEDTP